MTRNVEIKARVRNIFDLLNKAKELTGQEGIVLKQRDTFYNAPNGRYKMRTVTSEAADEEEELRTELIWYLRADTAGPKLSDYHKFDVPTEILDTLRLSLSSAMGVRGEVSKTRTLFLLGQTRIHVDQVEDLGDFMELEVVLCPDETLEKGEQMATEIREKLGVLEEDLLTGAYMDMLEKK